MKKLISLFLICLNILITTPVDAIASTDKFKYGLATFQENQIILKKGSVLKFSFLQDVNAEKLSIGQEIKFVLNKAIITKDKKIVLPKDTIITSYVKDISTSKSFNKNAQIFVIFTNLQLPTGEIYDLTARMHTKKGNLESSTILNAARLTGEVAGAFVITAGVLTLAMIAVAPMALIAFVFLAPCTLISTSALGVYQKGLNFKVKAGKPVSIQVVKDLIIQL